MSSNIVLVFLASCALLSAHVDQVSEVVQTRYEALPYPSSDDIKALWYHILEGPLYLNSLMQNLFDKRFDYCDPDTPLRILVAGCGTGIQMAQLATGMAAVTEQCPAGAAIPDWEITCLDLSSASLDIARQKIDMIGLEAKEHVTFVQRNILDVSPENEGVYDVIVSVGVLHHMESLTTALFTLQGVLRPGGGMYIMVYNTIGRSVNDLFRVQDAIQMLHEDYHSSSPRTTPNEMRHAEETHLRLAGSVLDALPQEHPHIMNNKAVWDNTVWEGIADRYLHPQENTYTPAELFDIVEKLTEQGFASVEGEGKANLQMTAGPSMELRWGHPDEYDPRKHIPDMFQPEGMLDFNTLTSKRAAQLAHLVNPKPPRNHYFFIVSPQAWRPDRYLSPDEHPVPGLKSGSSGAAWRGLGRNRHTTAPFGNPLSCDYAMVGKLNARSFNLIGLTRYEEGAVDRAIQVGETQLTHVLV